MADLGICKTEPDTEKPTPKDFSFGFGRETWRRIEKRMERAEDKEREEEGKRKRRGWKKFSRAIEFVLLLPRKRERERG